MQRNWISTSSALAWLMLLAAMPLSGQTVAAETDRATVLILDASGSMWGQLPDGHAKIEVARDVLSGFFASRDGSVPLGVVAYGHNRKGDCNDIAVIAETGLQDAGALSKRLMSISPKGKTPLGQSLRVATGQIPRTAEEADIVLVTDGLETCDVDPCAVARELAAEGIRIRAHVVGFGLSSRDAEALACIPDETGGLLLTPQSGDELAEALVRTTRVEPAGEPAGPGLTFFEGERFEGQSFTVAEDVPNFDSIPFEPGFDGDANDAAYSVRVRGRWEICLDADYSGGCQIVEGDLATLGAYGGSVSSARQVGDEAAIRLPRATMRNRGPYGIGTAWIDLSVLAEGTETGGAALALRLYPAGGGDAITYSTVEGKEGIRDTGINLEQTGRYLLRLETWGGDLLDQMTIDVESDPVVTLIAPPVVAPGQPIAVESTGGQLRSDSIQVWRGDERLDWGGNLAELAMGQVIAAPAEPGAYDLVYYGYDAGGDYVEKARTPFEVGTVEDDATGETAQRQKVEADDMGHGPDGESDGRPWDDYPFHCLGEQACEMRDGETGLAFTLPAGWVADQPSRAPMSAGAAAAGEELANPYVEFFESRGNLNRIILNPRQWIDDNGPCAVTRAGTLCLWRNDAAPDDDNAYEALALLQATMTTGRVMRRCPLREDCSFEHPNPPLSGRMPQSWSAEVGRPLPDGRIATWFFDRDRGGNFKLIGLNQDGGENCQEAAPGSMLCEFTPYIATGEFELIRSNLVWRGGSRTLTPEEILDRLAPSRTPAP